MGASMINHTHYHTHRWFIIDTHPVTWRPRTKFQFDWFRSLAVKITHACTYTYRDSIYKWISGPVAALLHSIGAAKYESGIGN